MCLPSHCRHGASTPLLALAAHARTHLTPVTFLVAVLCLGGELRTRGIPPFLQDQRRRVFLRPFGCPGKASPITSTRPSASPAHVRLSPSLPRARKFFGDKTNLSTVATTLGLSYAFVRLTRQHGDIPPSAEELDFPLNKQHFRW